LFQKLSSVDVFCYKHWYVSALDVAVEL